MSSSQTSLLADPTGLHAPAVQIIHVAPRPNDPHSADVARNLSDALASRGLLVTPDPLASQMVIAIGGDGTVLYWADRLQDTSIPILGVNTGHVGFLTATGDPTLVPDIITSSQYVVEKRTRVQVAAGPFSDFALNEISLVTANPGRAVRARIEVDGQPLFAFTGDGVVISTPTGSTGYALSAGGPLVSPQIPALVIATLTPSTFIPGTFLLPDHSIVTVHPDPARPMLVLADSTQVTVLRDTSATIQLASKSTFLVRTEPWIRNIASRFSLDGSSQDLRRIAPAS